jgi:hypothetical protein
MNPFLLTLLAASVLVLASVGLLAIGWLITGKSKIIRGACGMNPHRSRDEDCGKETSCGLCHKETGDDKTEQKEVEDDDDA